MSHALQEFLKTEEEYLKDLSFLNLNLVEPCVELIGKNEAKLIFSNLTVVYNINYEFRNRLCNMVAKFPDEETRKQKLAEIIIDMAMFFKVYNLYNPDIDKLEEFSAENPAFAEIVKNFSENPSSKYLDLRSFLVKPVQRICRYPLLLKEIIKKTPETMPSHSLLTKAQQILVEIAKGVDETKNVMSNQNHLAEIQASIKDGYLIPIVKENRSLLTSGIFAVSPKKDDFKDRQCFLFNDMILVCGTFRKNGKTMFKIKEKIDLEFVTSINASLGGFFEEACQITFRREDVQHELYFYASSIEQKNNWVKNVQNAKLELTKSQERKREVLRGVQRGKPLPRPPSRTVSSADLRRPVSANSPRPNSASPPPLNSSAHSSTTPPRDRSSGKLTKVFTLKRGNSFAVFAKEIKKNISGEDGGFQVSSPQLVDKVPGAPTVSPPQHKYASMRLSVGRRNKNKPKAMDISGPVGVKHNVHVEFDPVFGTFTGLPQEYQVLLKTSGIEQEEIMNSPRQVLNVLEFSKGLQSAQGEREEIEEETYEDIEKPKEGPKYELKTLVNFTERENPLEIFEVGKKIGAGAFAQVYESIDKRTNEKVAIKKEVITNKNMKYLISQIYIQKDSEHACIVPFKGCYLNKNELWVVLEFMHFGDLSGLINSAKKSKSITEEHIAYAMRELLKGLVYIHANHRIHRDIKSSNVMINKDGKIKIADFGSAMQLTEHEQKRQTFIGTPYWMAPEVIQKEPYTCEVDIWSLGVLLMEMADYHPPYHDLTTTKALFLISTKGLPPLREKKVKRSDELKDFLSKCVAKDPEQRLSAKELLKHSLIKKACESDSFLSLVKKVLDPLTS